jgi:DNA repair protein RecO
MNTFSTQAIILQRTNYSEVDRILQILTSDKGKVGAIAKGARKHGSKLAGGIELFSLSELTLHQGKGELYVVTSSRLNTFFNNIIADYDRLQLGYKYLRAISRASESASSQDTPEWFSLTLEVLQSLDNPKISTDLIDLWFSLQLSSLLGQGLNTLTDINGEKLQENERYHFDSNEMSFLLSENGLYSSDEIKFLRVAQFNPPKILHRINIDNEMLNKLNDVVKNLRGVYF